MWRAALMYKQMLYTTTTDHLDLKHVKKTNKAKAFKYGYNEDIDCVVISKTGVIGKIYEVNELINDNIVVITDNIGDQANYVMISGDDKVWFEDATPYIREDKLNELGI